MKLRSLALAALAIAALAPVTSVIAAATDSDDRRPPRPRPRAPRPSNGPSARMCTAQLVVAQTDRSAGCFIDERVTGSPGTLQFPCDGGPARASFRNGTFTGTVGADGAVSLALTTSFRFSDGCRWQSEQRIEGSLSGGRFRYTEHPVSGRSCAPPCSASGTVEVRR